MIKDLFKLAQGREPWPWQLSGVEEIIANYERGKSVCLQSPTGGGKSKMMWALTNWATQNRMRAGILTNRNSLCTQLSKDMSEAGIDHGMVASQHRKKFDLSKAVQLMMVQSEIAQSKRRAPAQLDVLLVDEAHMFQSGKFRELVQYHKDNGAYVVQVSATPVGLFKTCSDIIIAGTNSELREHGAHVPCLVRAPSEIDCDKVKRTATGEFIIGDKTRTIWNQQIVGHVYDEWREVNPRQEPSIIFGPDCPSALWLAKEFENRGVRVAYVDSSCVYWDGQERRDPKGELREMIFDMVRNGEIPALFNRFVCREGLDFPNLRHVSLATPIGSLKSYVQTVGRLLRYSKETPDVVHLSDHGGNWRRHGSPNADRDWEVLFRITEQELYKKQKADEDNPDSENYKQTTCPECKRVRENGPRCPDPPFGCGHECTTRQKFVIQADGSLKTVTEKKLESKEAIRKRQSQRNWDSLFWPQRKGHARGLTFWSLRQIYNRRVGCFPPDNLKHMPKDWEKHGGEKILTCDKEHLRW
ncbi:Type III restriction enzyme, res subunit [Rosistilla ulvae]|uniref:Type III restriction enzyme, res subunit n=1 Tax=Rosistilla ulvae TaxID=1930277 RepID=A0A517LXL4_9BACT|nr:DEAD/DEAH box helicase family protein [Rosistilla ulvae]QDS87368.1 Type III restriction enzyme, res subunit [Rosistilla ulvae]